MLVLMLLQWESSSSIIDVDVVGVCWFSVVVVCL